MINSIRNFLDNSVYLLGEVKQNKFQGRSYEHVNETSQSKICLVRIFKSFFESSSNHAPIEKVSEKQSFGIPDTTMHCLSFLQDLNVSCISKEFQSANLAAFDFLAQEYANSDLLKPYILETYPSCEIISGNGQAFVKQIYLNIRKEVEAFSGHQEIMSETKETYGSVLSVKRLEALVTWVKPKEIKNFLLFTKKIAAQVTPLTDFFSTLIDINKDEDKASFVKTWFKDNGTHLSDLEQLDLVGNSEEKLHKIPTEIKYFKNLKDLNLADNALQARSFPAEIKECSNLTVLNLYQNELTEIPVEISSCRKLESLYLGVNKIKNISAEVSLLTHLKILHLERNEINCVSEHIGLCQNLEEIQLDYNKLTSFPSGLYQCKNIKIVRANSNQISSFLEEVGNLKNLEILALTGNLLTALPKEIGSCCHLKELHVVGNKIDTLPEQIRNSSSLKTINIASNKLTSQEKKQLKELKGKRVSL